MNEGNVHTPPCVIVLGMHRSGTSLLTGSLEAAGLYLGEANNAAPYNRKGNKENEAIRDLNDALLEGRGAAWDRPPNGQIQWDRTAEERGRDLIEPYRRAARPWGFKDPRTVWTVEGWLRLLPRARLIGVFRHPSLVVRSLVARDGRVGMDPDAALGTWCAYNAELIRLQRKHAFPMLHFGAVETFRQEFVAPLACFAREIGLTGSPDRFFDRRLVHQSAPEPALTIEAREIFGQLFRICRRDCATEAGGSECCDINVA